MEFFCFLRDTKNLETNTILNYKAALCLPMSFIKVDLKKWQFKELGKALFIDKPPNQKRLPDWNLNKVLDMLENKECYKQQQGYHLMKKSVFLTALASGNRVCELAAIERSGIHFHDNGGVTMAVQPGFLFKNQRLGRAPPNITFPPLTRNLQICPVSTLRDYLQSSPASSGPLFLNTRTGRPIHSSSISRILCEVIEEADPGKLPKGHDLRRVSASLAWSRGVKPDEIVKRLFWASSSPFIKRYLVPVFSANCVAARSN